MSAPLTRPAVLIKHVLYVLETYPCASSVLKPCTSKPSPHFRPRQRTRTVMRAERAEAERIFHLHQEARNRFAEKRQSEFFSKVQNHFEVVAVSDQEELGCCPICLEKIQGGPLERKMRAARLPCQHLFHEGCIMEWGMKQNTCPMCRSTV